MSILQQSIVEKVGYDNGFEYVLPCTMGVVNLGSAHHFAKVAVTILPTGFVLHFMQATNAFIHELSRHYANQQKDNASFQLADEKELAQFLKHSALLARSLPNQALLDYEDQVTQALSNLTANDIQSTEIQRMVRQRVGQDRYRQAMLDYWGNACSVTGLSLTSALKASHAKPWAECVTDAERLDVFNGFLLSANLDALFDQFLISFTDDGALLSSEQISKQDCELLGLNKPLKLRWISPSHLPYLSFHRARFGVVG